MAKYLYMLFFCVVVCISRCNQKGTIGQLIAQADLPFTRDGLVPDILFNSHGIPSRMTMGQLWNPGKADASLCRVAESVISKLNALAGLADGQFGIPFTETDRLIGACDALHTAGLPRMGREQLYSGVSGGRSERR